ncbi:hypothetical protein BJ165DRAFT_1534244 [Panaeolus papilionaceus]|nr:hypothetical protein BJ165DRAFT_1534244 [Panaeolus papilionaceus]
MSLNMVPHPKLPEELLSLIIDIVGETKDLDEKVTSEQLASLRTCALASERMISIHRVFIFSIIEIPNPVFVSLSFMPVARRCQQATSNAAGRSCFGFSNLRRLNSFIGIGPEPDARIQALRNELVATDDLLTTNCIYLPPPETDLDKCYWPVIHKYRKISPNIRLRSLWVKVMEDGGTSLVDCTDSVDMAECLLHILLCWLSLFQMAYFFRAVELRNALRLTTPSTSHKPRNLWEVSDHPLAKGRDTNTKVDLRRLSPDLVIDEDHQELLGTIEELEATLKRAGVTNEDKAIILKDVYNTEFRYIECTPSPLE